MFISSRRRRGMEVTISPFPLRKNSKNGSDQPSLFLCPLNLKSISFSSLKLGKEMAKKREMAGHLHSDYSPLRGWGDGHLHSSFSSLRDGGYDHIHVKGWGDDHQPS